MPINSDTVVSVRCPSQLIVLKINKPVLPVTIYLEVTFRTQILEKPKIIDEIEDCQGVGRTVRRAIKIHMNQFHVI